VIDREATTDWGGAAGASHESSTTGANAMRVFLALGLLIALHVSATAAHARPRHHGYHYGSYASYGGYGYGYGGYSGHNSSQWGGQPD
jgi:hypothetical protein